MMRRTIAAIFLGLIVLAVVFVVVKRGNWLPAGNVLAIDQAPTEQNVIYSQNFPVGASASIDPASLTSSSPNPTITGTALNISEISIQVSKGKSVPQAQYQGPGSIPNAVWGYTSGNPGFSLSDGRWSATVDYREHIPLLTRGIYTVAVYGYSYLLAYGYLTII